MPNKIVGDYEVIEPPVGRGGFGVTHKAQHVHLPNRLRAVKLVEKAYVSAFKEAGPVRGTSMLTHTLLILAIGQTPVTQMSWSSQVCQMLCGLMAITI